MTIENTREIDQSGWWTGSIYVNQAGVADEALDSGIDDVDRRMIHSILKDWEPKDDVGGLDVVSVFYLNDVLREQVAQQIREGNDYGTVYYDGEDISWSMDLDCTLDGKEVDWWDLSDDSREHIAHGIIEDGWKQGEICENAEVHEKVVFDEYALKGKKGYLMTGNARGTYEYTDYDGETIGGEWEWERDAYCPLMLDLESVERSGSDDNSLGGLEEAAIENMILEAVSRMDKNALEQEKAHQKKSGRRM